MTKTTTAITIVHFDNVIGYKDYRWFVPMADVGTFLTEEIWFQGLNTGSYDEMFKYVENDGWGLLYRQESSGIELYLSH